MKKTKKGSELTKEEKEKLIDELLDKHREVYDRLAQI